MSAPDTEGDAAKTRHAGWSSAIWLSVVILVLYVLSPGPAFMLATQRPVGVNALQVFYAPLGFLCDRVPAVHAFYDWYLPLWGIK